MVAASWGDSDLENEQEEMKTKCLMADKELNELSAKQSVLL